MKTSLLLISLLVPVVTFAKLPDWDSPQQQAALKKMMAAGEKFCAESGSSSSTPDKTINSVQDLEHNKNELPLVGMLREEVEYQEQPDNSLEGKKKSYELLLQKIKANQGSLSEEETKTIQKDSGDSFEMGKNAFLQHRIKKTLISTLTDPKKKQEAAKAQLMTPAMGKMFEDLVLKSKNVIVAIENQKAALEILSLEIARIDTELANRKFFSQLQEKSRATDAKRLEEFQKNSPVAPFTTEQLIKGYQDYLNETTLVGMGFKDCSLTVAEQAAIESYSEGSYMYINKYLWSDSKPKDQTLDSVIAGMISGMKKLNPYVGIVYRDVEIQDPTKFLDDHKVGKEVVYKGFTSTSIRGGFAPQRKIHLVIVSKSGRYISPLAQLWTESEVLFMPGAKFKVLKVSDQTDGSKLIHMQEI